MKRATTKKRRWPNLPDWERQLITTRLIYGRAYQSADLRETRAAR